MPARARSSGSRSRLNWGLWRERGMVRTSVSRPMPWEVSSSISSSTRRVPWPIVHGHRQVICPRPQSTPEPEDRQFACVAAGGSFNLAIVILRRLVGLFLAAAILALAAAAQASPPDQSWISGLYDNADFDDVVLLITSNLAAVDPSVVSSSRLVATVVSLVPPAASFPPTASALS